MFKNSQNGKVSREVRRGSIVALAVAMIVSMLMISGYSVNLAYIELVRSEQRLATDAAVKAAGVVLGTSQSVDAARTAAKSIGAKHQVAGAPLVLTDAMLEFGVSSPNANGSYTFSRINNPSTATTINAVRATTNLNQRSGGGATLVAFAGVMAAGNSSINMTNFSPTMSAIATRIDIDLCLVVDRSASMGWDLTNASFSYPAEMNGKSPIQNYLTKPHATLSRWASLQRAVNIFTTVLSQNPFYPQVALASFASEVEFGVFNSTLASLDVSLGNNYNGIPSKITSIGTKPLMGNTNVAAGLRVAIAELLNPSDPSKKRVTSTKHIVLLCDGMMTTGTDDPVAIAAAARAFNVRISTIAFGAQADVVLMQNIASAGGGTSYVAINETQLTQVFRTIAATLPSVLTE